MSKKKSTPNNVYNRSYYYSKLFYISYLSNTEYSLTEIFHIYIYFI